jgi:hypothetical protein
VKEGGYGGYPYFMHVVMYENRSMKFVEIILRGERGDEGE